MLNEYITGVAGFEPTHEGVKVPCLTAWLYPKKSGGEWIRTTEPKGTDLQSAAFSHFATPPYDYRKNLTGVAGFEPTHEGVKVPCLTAWLYPKKSGGEWIRTTEPKGTDLQSAAFSHFATPPYVFQINY